MRSFRSLHFAVCLAALAVASCSLHSKGPGAAPESASEARFITETTKHAQAQFSVGKFKRALELYSSALEKNYHPELLRGYARLGEQIKSAADAAYQSGNIAKAGIDYNILLESGITLQNFAETLTFDGNDLRKQIKACSKSLLESGLKKYREEKLDEAIAIWKKALSFDPDNENVKNAFETASAQLQKLKQLR